MKILNNLIYGFRNLWRWKSIIWNDSQSDYCYLLLIMNKKLELMENFFDSDDAHLADHKKVAKDLRLLRLLLERIGKDDYILMKSNIFNQFGFKHAEYLLRQDLELATKLINRKLISWWD